MRRIGKRDEKGRRETRKGLLGLFARRDGDGLVATCAMTVVLCTDRAQSICRRMRDYEFFPTNTRFTTNTPPLHLFLLNNNTGGI